MKIRHKHTKCYNCNHKLLESYNYCPQCGQENNDNNISFNLLLREFFHNYFSLDSRFSRSIKPFFIKPGYLTNEYISGRRVTFMNPVRLYLIMSLFFFFMFSIGGQKLVEDDDEENSIVKIKGLDEPVVTNNDTLDIDSLSNLVQNRIQDSSNQPQDEEEDLEDSNQDYSKYYEQYTDTTKYSDEDTWTINGDPDESFILTGRDWAKLNRLAKNDDLSENQILDSLATKSLSGFEIHILRQVIRSNRADESYLAGYILKNLPLMMFLIIPLFALLLKILYVRRKQFLYIHHLIHALHLHSFAYLMYGIAIILMIYAFDEDTAAVFGFVMFLVVTYYAWRSFLKVYLQHWFKTTFKFLLLGVLYLGILFFSFMAELFISFLLF